MKIIISVYTKESRQSKINNKIKEKKKLIILLITIAFLIFVDQLIKVWVIKNIYNSGLTIINGFFNLTYVENTGGAFGIGNNNIFTFIIVNIIIITLIGKFILLKKDEVSITILVSLVLIVTGGIANLIDRLFRGFVVDYIDFSPLIKYPVFNFADVYVVVGCLIIGINIIVGMIKERNK